MDLIPVLRQRPVSTRKSCRPSKLTLGNWPKGNEQMSKYSDLLKHPKWQKKRLEIMNRDGFKCVECGDDENQLHVHHLVYRKGKKPWEYPEWELATLCEFCHTVEHDNMNQTKDNSVGEFFSCSQSLVSDYYELPLHLNEMTAHYRAGEKGRIISLFFSYLFKNGPSLSQLEMMFKDKKQNQKNWRDK